MTLLQYVQKSEQKRRALLQAQYTSLKAYRGVPYQNIANAKAVHGNLTYRGVSYSR